jgi:phenylalanyl-tRNA synthetase beta chain
MVFSYNWLKEYLKGKIPSPKALAEILTSHSFEVTEVKKIGKDFVLDIDILPNRAPDCFSHFGLARECSAILNLKLQPPNYKLKEHKDLKTKDFLQVEIKDKKALSRYTARVITNVKVAPSPKWLKKKLKVCGIKPINNIVDIANFVMLETGQPLHAFDLEKLEGKKIIVRYAQEGERIITLDEKKYFLNKDILVIADEKSPIAIAGIKGGILPEIDRKTKLIVLESANFNPRVIRKGSRKLNLKTDASHRFEHGIDPNLTEFAINRASFLIQKIARGKVAQGIIDFYPEKVLPKKIKLDLKYVENLLGAKIPLNKIKSILKRLNFSVTPQLLNSSTPQLLVEIPTFRLDIKIPEDLIEEIGRIYGYEEIKPIFPTAALVPPERNLDIFWQNFTKDVLKEAGFTEVYNYSFIGKKQADIFAWPKQELIELENPTSENYKYLRPSLIPNLLKNVKENLKNFKEIKIFELGKIFKKTSKNEILEKRALTALIFSEGDSSNLFFELKGVCTLLFEKMGISDFWFDFYQPTPEESKISIWFLPKSAEIKIGHEEIGFMGEISPKITEKLKIGKVVVFDFDFEKLKELASEEQEYIPISRYPAAIRDVSVLVPQNTLVEEVQNIIEIAGGPLVTDVDLFDIYEGENIPIDKKSLSFHIIFQSPERTLKSKEIDALFRKIINALEKKWEVRKI